MRVINTQWFGARPPSSSPGLIPPFKSLEAFFVALWRVSLLSRAASFKVVFLLPLFFVERDRCTAAIGHASSMASSRLSSSKKKEKVLLYNCKRKYYSYLTFGKYGRRFYTLSVLKEWSGFCFLLSLGWCVRTPQVYRFWMSLSFV